MNKNIIFTEPSDADRNISSMFRYLKSKSIRPLQITAGIDPHLVEMLRLSNEGTLDFFKMIYNDDLKRMGLI